MANETKNCPYCGEEILAVAKKCKHCGMWLTEKEPKCTVTTSGKPTSINSKKWMYVTLAILVVAGLSFFMIYKSSGKPTILTEDTITNNSEYVNQEAKSRFNTKLRDLEGMADYLVKYKDGRYIWYNVRSPYGYSTALSVYDSETGNTSFININKTSLSDEDVTVHDILEHNGKITVVLEEHRNSNGWVEGTHVWTIDCSNRNWECIADGVASAEIINNGSAVKITSATILNPDAPTFEQKYRESTKTITL